MSSKGRRIRINVYSQNLTLTSEGTSEKALAQIVILLKNSQLNFNFSKFLYEYNKRDLNGKK